MSSYIHDLCDFYPQNKEKKECSYYLKGNNACSRLGINDQPCFYAPDFTLCKHCDFTKPEKQLSTPKNCPYRHAFENDTTGGKIVHICLANPTSSGVMGCEKDNEYPEDCYLLKKLQKKYKRECCLNCNDFHIACGNAFFVCDECEGELDGNILMSQKYPCYKPASDERMAENKQILEHVMRIICEKENSQ